MKPIIILLLTLLIFSCQNKHHESTNHDSHETNHKHQHDKEATNEANTHMHQSSVSDLVERFESPERDAYQKPELVLDYLGDINGKHIMDIGAGSGYFSVKLADQGAHVIAADVDDEFLDYLKERIATNNLQHIEVRKIPYDSPDLKDEEVDMVLIVNTYHHIEDRSTYFKKVKQGTKPDGELVLIDFFKTELPVGPSVDHKLSMDTVITELKAAGYTTFDVNVDLLPYQYIIKAK